MKVKEKKCRFCGKMFTPFSSLQVCCSVVCALSQSALESEKKKQKEWNVEKKKLKEKNKTHSEHLNELQKIFNTYIRLRDKGCSCISCNTNLKDKYDAGHYFSVGAYPNLRFNEDNCFGQCVHCNQHLHGNLIEYSERLLDRIGYDRMNELKAKKHEPLHLSTVEIIELKKVYKYKIKQLSHES